MISLKIDNTERKDLIKWQSLRRDNRLNNDPDKLEFTIKENDTFQPTGGEEVILSVDNVREFAGKIVRVKENVVSPLQVEYKCVCNNWVYDLNGNLVTEKYENTDVESIINDIVTNYVSAGFTTNNVVASTVGVDSIAFNRLSVAECLQKLGRLTSFFWYVDYNKDIHFAPKTQEPAPFDLTDDSNNSDYGKFIFTSLEVKEDLSQIKNKVTVQGGEEEANERTSTYDGSEVNSEGILDLSYKFAEKPTVTVNGTTQNVGVEFINDDSNFDVLWSFSSKYLRFTQTSVSGGDTIAVSGNPLFPILIRVKDNDSIAKYGVREDAIKDTTIRTREEARDRASAELEKYAEEVIDGKFATRTSGLRAGQVMNINVRGTNEDVLLQSVKMQATDPEFNVAMYEVQFATLDTIGIIQFLQKQIIDEDIKEDEDEELLSLLTPSDTATFTDELKTPTTKSSPYKYSDDALTTNNPGVYNFSTYA